MKKTLVIFGAVITVFLTINTATAVPNSNSKIVLNQIEKMDERIEIYKDKNISTNLLDLFKQILDFLERIFGSVLGILNLIWQIIQLIDYIIDLLNPENKTA